MIKIAVKSFFFTIALFCFFVIAKADQLEALTREQAIKASEILRAQNSLILWCGCCENDPKKVISSVISVSYEKVGNEEYYQIILTGKDENQLLVKTTLDLAYVYINKNGLAVCLGKELNYPCDPCSAPFQYGSSISKGGNNEVRINSPSKQNVQNDISSYNSSERPLLSAEVMPSFPGGEDALLNYIRKNLVYPEEAITKEIEGRVIINFVVSADGSISNVKCIKDIGGGCGQAAINLVQAMPNWNPGISNGVKVAIAYNLPVFFTLQ